MKNSLTPAGIGPATFRFVAQHLDHCATAVPEYSKYGWHIRVRQEGNVDGSPSGICEVLLFYVNGRIEECVTPNTGRMTQNPATASTHQTRSDEKVHKIHRLDRIGVQVSG